MSFQRILETARRMNSPLIVTDAAGREPMVVMTLQAYERLQEGGQAPQPKPVAVAQTEPTLVPTPPMKESVAPKAEAAPTLQEISIQVMDTQEIAQDSEISMEERFYLEPMDEASK